MKVIIYVLSIDRERDSGFAIFIILLLRGWSVVGDAGRSPRPRSLDEILCAAQQASALPFHRDKSRKRCNHIFSTALPLSPLSPQQHNIITNHQSPITTITIKRYLAALIFYRSLDNPFQAHAHQTCRMLERYNEI